ncbi:MAG: hypothetical protein PHQ09_04555 [Actinomycetota bacterium]|nr:hypothetical protein [Actinomycetota bacterium]
MNEERKTILEMLAEGKINTEEAERLLSALSKETETGSDVTKIKSGYKYLRVVVEPGPESENSERVNIRVPLKLIRAGLKLASFIPKDAQVKVNEALHEKGIDTDFSKIKPEDLEDLLGQLNDLTVDVEGKEKIKVFCE